MRILREYERGVVFRLGRLLPQKGPGVVFLIPFVDRLVRVSLRTVTLKVPAQDVITRDNVPARVTAVTYFRVVDPNKSIVEIQDVLAATSQIAQTTLRSILGKADLDTLLARAREAQRGPPADHRRPDRALGRSRSPRSRSRTSRSPSDMQRAIARQAEAERERRAKIINAEGEFQAAAKLSDAADVISRNPVTIQLRYLQTLLEIGGEQNSTVVFPLPIDLIQPLLEAVQGPVRPNRPARGSGPPGQRTRGRAEADAAPLTRAPLTERPRTRTRCRNSG